ncbi:unnamed protein product, partial [Notodromas monacha]
MTATLEITCCVNLKDFSMKASLHRQINVMGAASVSEEQTAARKETEICFSPSPGNGEDSAGYEMCIPGLHDDDTETVEETMPVAKRKEKRRNTEKRKERSRDAARSRRSKEAEYFSDLASLLPYPESLVAHLDKASIMRLSITYLKLKSFVDCALPESGTPSISDSPWSSPLRLGVENFALCDTGPDHVSGLVSLLFIVSSDGEIIYVSENVSDQLGLLQ